MNKTKVCVMTSVHPPFDVRIFYKECRTLAHAGYDVTLVVPHERDEVLDGIQIKAVSKPINRKERFLKTRRNVFNTALEINADIYHLHDPELLPFASRLKRKGSIVVFDMHENLPRAVLSKTWIRAEWRSIIAKAVRCGEKILLKNIPVIYAESSYKNDYPWISCFQDVLNMPDITAISHIDKSQKNDMFTVGYVGGVSEVRGSLMMLAAIKKLQAIGYSVRFDCIGPVSNKHLHQLESFIKDNKLENVNLHGYIIPKQAWQLIARSHVGLAVLKPIPNYIESYPTKMFEYMALGIPVITSSFPLYRRVVEDNKCGFCIDHDQPEQLAEAIEWIINNQEEAQLMGINGLNAARTKYNWDIEGEKLLDFYKKLSGRM